MSKEKGMLFNGDMVRGFLNGQKTQTRRPAIIDHSKVAIYRNSKKISKVFKPSPFGKIGDKIWVRETWNCGTAV